MPADRFAVGCQGYKRLADSPETHKGQGKFSDGDT